MGDAPEKKEARKEAKRGEAVAVQRAEPARALERWEPFRELWEWRPFGGRSLFPSRFGRALDRLFDEYAEDWPGARAALVRPAVDVSEGEKAYRVTVELPGTSKDDVKVELSEGMLTIRGEKKSEREQKKEHARYVERVYGSFSRSFSLPKDADPNRIEAGFKDGVLTLTIEKREEAKPKTISIR